MASLTTTYQTYAAKGLREDLSDVIYNISPTDTPFMSRAGRDSAKQTLVEWQTDSLAAAISTNVQVQGEDYTSYPAATASVRVGNYTNISHKLIQVARTLDAVDKAGRRSETAYQASKRSAELKRDMEKMALENIGGDAGAAATAAQMATLGAWIKTNTSTGTSGGDPTYTSGVPAAARTDGTQRAFSETLLKAVILDCFTNGGKPDTLMCGPVNTQKASAFTGIATRNFDLSNTRPRPTAIIGAANVYVSDFGTFQIAPNRFQRERDALLLDFDYLAFSYLRPFGQRKLADNADAERRVIVVEWTLKVKQEAALGLVADLTTT